MNTTAVDDMPYIRENLLSDETLIFATRPHWIIFMPAVLSFIIALLCYMYGARYFMFDAEIWHGYRLYEMVSMVVGAVGVYWLLTAFITYKTSEYGVTDKRVLMKTGWVRRTSVELFLRKLEAINVDQSIPGRLLNYGTIMIIGTGGTNDPYLYVPTPLHFRKIVQQQVDKLIDEEDHR